MIKEIICPNCGNKCFFLLDEWGHTPWHLHCTPCHINIGAQSIDDCVNLFAKYHQPHTLLEHYWKKIQWLMVDGEDIIDIREMK